MSGSALVDEAAARILSSVRSTTTSRHEPGSIRTRSGPRSPLTDTFVVASSRRFRAAHRARFRESVRRGMIVVMAAAALDVLAFGPLHPSTFGLLVGFNLLVAAVAGISYGATAVRGHRRPEVFVFLTLATVEAATIALGVAYPELSVVAIGYLLLLPTIVALVIEWETRSHVAWLTVHATAVLWYAWFVLTPVTDGGARGDLIALLAVATTVSQFGHVVALRARVVSFVQIERIRALNRQARRDETRLDRLNVVLEQSAMTDELTGLKNRLSLRLDLRVIRARIARQQELYCMLVLDLDRFKVVNDTEGHIAGDTVLRAIAKALSGATRAGDNVYRYGGEEFVVLVRVADADEAIATAERMRRAVEDLDLPHPGNPPHDRVTISVGVAVFGPKDSDADDDAWIARADVALYRAKAHGRNRTESATEIAAFA